MDPFHTIEYDPAIVFALDRELRIIYCNRAWDVFAEANGGAFLKRPAPYGLPLLDVIPEELKALYRSAYLNVFATKRQWAYEYECSSATVYRLFRMTALRRPKVDFVWVTNFLLEESPHGDERRPVIYPNPPAYGEPDESVRMCCLCRRTRRKHGRVWDWVPAYVKTPPARVAPAVCEDCDRKLKSSINALSRAH